MEKEEYEETRRISTTKWKKNSQREKYMMQKKNDLVIVACNTFINNNIKKRNFKCSRNFFRFI